jgi:hypothetical protein
MRAFQCTQAILSHNHFNQAVKLVITATYSGMLKSRLGNMQVSCTPMKSLELIYAA